MDRQKQIMEAAAKIFIKNGFSRARMDDIAKEAGLSKGTLYLYFKNKEDIILTLFHQIFQTQEEGTEELIETDGITVREKIIQLVRFSVEQISEMKDLLRISYEFYAMASHNERIEKHLRKYFRSNLDVIIRLMQQGIDQGEFRELDPKQMAFAFAALLEGIFLLWIADPISVSLDEAAENSTLILLEGFKPR